MLYKYSVSQKHLMFWTDNSLRQSGKILLMLVDTFHDWELMLIIIVWIWHYAGDHHVIQYIPVVVTVDRMSQHVSISPGIP
jgi:hypothetical protein